MSQTQANNMLKMLEMEAQMKYERVKEALEASLADIKSRQKELEFFNLYRDFHEAEKRLKKMSFLS